MISQVIENNNDNNIINDDLNNNNNDNDDDNNDDDDKDIHETNKKFKRKQSAIDGNNKTKGKAKKKNSK